MLVLNVVTDTLTHKAPTGADMQRRQSVQGCLCAGIKRCHRYANTQSSAAYLRQCGKYVSKAVDVQGRLSYIYKIQTTQGLREFKIAIGSNGYIVSFIPNWL